MKRLYVDNYKIINNYYPYLKSVSLIKSALENSGVTNVTIENRHNFSNRDELVIFDDPQDDKILDVCVKNIAKTCDFPPYVIKFEHKYWDSI